MSEWIKHDGGPCPVDVDIDVEFRMRQLDDDIRLCQAGSLSWDVITSYRLAEPQAHMMSAPAPVVFGVDLATAGTDSTVVVETVGGIGGGPERDVVLAQDNHLRICGEIVSLIPKRQHVSDAAWQRARMVGGDHYSLECHHEARGLMLVTVEEWDALSRVRLGSEDDGTPYFGTALEALADAERAAQAEAAYANALAACLAARDALIAELQAKLAHEQSYVEWLLQRIEVAGPTPRPNTGALLLNLPEQRVQFGKGNG
jgi:hypothetical protein